MCTVRLTTLIVSGVSVAAMSALTGCGVAGTEFHPGIAASVGDQSITVDTVDALATDYCAAYVDTFEGRSVPLSFLRSGIVGRLAQRAAVEQLAEEYDVSPGTTYQRSVSMLRKQGSQLDEEASAAMVEIDSTPAYVEDVLSQVGEKVLRERGQRNPTLEQQLAAGQEELTAWLEDNEPEVDPRFGIEFSEGQPVPLDTDLSVPVGETAKSGSAEELDAEYAAGLPEAQACRA